MYDVILGWDFGHGENCVEMIRYGSGNDSISLKLDSEKNQEIPTVIAYGDKGEAIGYAAAPHYNAISYFKSRPDLWDAKVNGRAKKDIIFDFFKTSMKNIREHNKTNIFDEDKILLLVGCPSAKEWTSEENKEKYEVLIKEATGVDKVIVIPESRAALLSVFTRNTDIVVDTYQGAGVFDFGSSTADFTYMKFGEHMLEYSRNLGGVYVERNMLKKILTDNGLSVGQIWEQEIGNILLTLRFQKENYYAYGEEKTHVFEPIMIDENGDPVLTGKTRKDGTPVYRRRAFSYRLDDDFMAEVTSGMSFTIEDNYDILSSRSWYDHFRGFIVNIKNTLESKKLPIKNIILTGGASRMDFVEKSVKEVFGEGCSVFIEKNPSHSVSTGLCKAGITDLRLEEIIPATKKEIYNKVDASIEELIAEISNVLSVEIYNNVRHELKCIADSNENYTIGRIKERIEQSVSKELTESKIQSIFDPRVANWLDKCKQIIVNEVNNAAKSLYPDEISNRDIRISKDSSTFNGIKLEFSNGAFLNDMDFLSTIDKIIKNIIVWVIAVIAYACLNFLGFLVHMAAEIFADYLFTNKDRVIKANNCVKIYESFNSDEKKFIGEINKKVTDQTRNVINENLNQQEGGRYAVFEGSIDSAMNIMALREFEHTYYL